MGFVKQQDPRLSLEGTCPATGTKTRRLNSLLSVYTRARQGDVDAFSELIRPHERAIYVVCLAFASDGVIAEEIALEAVYHAFTSLSSLEGLKQLRMFLVKIAVSAASSVRPGRSSKSEFDGASASLLHDASELAGVLPILALFPHKSVTRKTAAAALFACPQRDRIVLVLRDVLGFTSSEAAEILGTTRKTVTESLSFARNTILQKFVEFIQYDHPSGMEPK